MLFIRDFSTLVSFVSSFSYYVFLVFDISEVGISVRFYYTFTLQAPLPLCLTVKGDIELMKLMYVGLIYSIDTREWNMMTKTLSY